MFFISILIGRKMFTTTETVQAQPVTPSIIEVPMFAKVQPKEKSVDEINVEIDLSTSEVSVKGATDANVSVKTVGEPKPIVKYKIKTVTDTLKTGYPLVRGILKVHEKPQSLTNYWKDHEQQDYIMSDGKIVFNH